MKIGVLTLSLHVNYGGILQAYALKTVLERRGHDVWFINRDYWPEIDFRTIPVAIMRGLGTAFKLRGKIPLRTFRGFNHLIHVRRKDTQDFIETHVGQNISVSNIRELAQDGLDALVVGSDQIWRPGFARMTLRAPIENVFLSFATTWNVRRLSYAASFGVDEWDLTTEETDRCSELLKMFDGVSVRELSGVRLCDEYLGVKAEHVLDPTMLLDDSDYDRLTGADAQEEREKGVFAYILDNTEDKTMVVDRVASFTNSSVFTISLNEIVVPPVESWLQAFRDAKFVVTDSFHACIFSILYKKPFFVYGNRIRGITRITSLLSMFCLENRLLSSFDDLSDEKLSTNIDWGRIHALLMKERAASFDFLDKTLTE